MKVAAKFTPRANRLAGLFEPATVVLFAGLGGVCIGVEQAYVDGGYKDKYIDLAINHWDKAVGVHELNHPMTQHLRANVLEVDPRKVLLGRRLAYLHLSPDCTDFSKAKGKAPKRKHIRALADVGLVWADLRRPDVITLENVEEFKEWGPLDEHGQPDKNRRGEEFDRWVRTLESLGYVVECRELRACDYGTPTTRKRLFVSARRDGKPVIWPEVTHASAKAIEEAKRRIRLERMGLDPDELQKLKHIATCKRYRTAAECIDWNQPMLSIFATRREARAWARFVNSIRPAADRVGVPQRPLRPKTQARLAGGLWKWVLNALEPFIISIENYGWNPNQTRGASEPLSTVTAGPRGGKHAAVDVQLAASYTGTFNHGGEDHRTADVREPMSTITAARDARGVVNVELAGFTAGVGGRAGQSPATPLDQPIPTVTGKADRIVATASLSAFTVPRHGEAEGQLPRSGSVENPLPTITGTDNGAQLVTVYLANYHSEKGDEIRGQSLDEPIRTLDTQNRFAEVSAYLLKFRGDSVGSSMNDSVPTVTSGAGSARDAGAAHALGTAAVYLSHMYSSSAVGGQGDPAKPLKTITANTTHANLCVVYLASFYGEGSGLTGHTPADPMPTVTSKDRFGLVQLETCPHFIFTPSGLSRARQVAKWARKLIGKKVDGNLLWVLDPETGKKFPLLFVKIKGAMHIITDIAMRMLRPRELARAQGFDDSYVIDRMADGTPLSKADQVRLIGNSVCPQLARAIAKANVVDLGVLEDARELVSA